MMESKVTPELSSDEIYGITHYRRAAEQLRALKELGIQAKRRHDNTVCVLRMHAMQPANAPASSGPTLKSSRK